MLSPVGVMQVAPLIGQSTVTVVSDDDGGGGGRDGGICGENVGGVANLSVVLSFRLVVSVATE